MLSKFTLFLALCSATAIAQSKPPAQSDRILAHPNLTPTARLSGHIPAWAHAESDLGPIPDATPINLALVLTRSPELQSAFTRFLEDQQNSASPSYHHWLTPQQVGELYGPTQHDLDTLTAWLTAQGLAVTDVAPSRVFVHVAAPAAVVSRAFATSLHSFRVDPQAAPRRAPTAEPSLPAALIPLVGSITGLADAPLHPMHQSYSVEMPRPQASGEPHPQITSSVGNHYVTPGDFAVIFDAKPTYSAGYNGQGQRVAIIGRSRVATTDITQFETNTGLPANLPHVVIPTNGVDPGITGDGDQGEATLDVVRVIGTAPGVQADLVVSGSAGGFNGIYVAAQYEVQTLLDPVMNISFGSCEVYAGPAQVNLWDTLFAQAASQGISVFVSSADSGAAACDTQFAPVPAYQFRSINYICSSSYATCVGGTQLAETAVPGNYWSSANSSTLVSALTYISEGAWNEPYSSNLAIVAASGGGGASIYVPKPSWQTGTGVPADGARDVPDVSFPAAAHDGYYACYAAGGGDCSANRFSYFAGTSAAAPAMAAITAILNQKTGSSQGNLNPLLYRVAAVTPSAFHDTTPASSGALNCSVGLASICNNSLPSTNSLTGGLAGYALTTGYDQATGLGSLDITNFLNAASSRPTALASGKLTVSESASTISRNQTLILTAAFTSIAAGAPTGSVQFYANTSPLGSPLTLSSGKAVTAPIAFPSAGSYDITAVYSGDATFAQATAPGISLTVTGLTAVPKITVSPATFALGGAPGLNISFPAAGSTPPTGMVRLFSSGPVSGYMPTIPVVAGSAGSNLYYTTAGTYTVTAYYLGDANYSPSTSLPVTVSVQKVQTFLGINPIVSIGVGGYQQFIASFMSGSGTPPQATGTIQLLANGAPLGSPFDATLSRAPVQQFTSPGTYTISATYSGDTNWQPATVIPFSMTVVSDPAAYQISSLTPSLTLTAGASVSNVAQVRLTSKNGFDGVVNLACSVTYTGTGVATVPPTCSIATNAVSLSTSGAPITDNISIVTIAGQAAASSGPSASNVPPASGSHSKSYEAALLCALLLCLPVRRRSIRLLSSALSLTVLFAFVTGCGSNTSTTSQTPTPTPTPIVGTTKGTYSVTISGTTSLSTVPVPTPATVTLTVN